jgi:hypothetical protein
MPIQTDLCVDYIEKTKNHQNTLNTVPNKEGFNKRRDTGLQAGRIFLKMLQEHPNINRTPDGAITDFLDIVCHSMGYAYAMEVIDALKGEVPFARLYIIAPENAGSGGTDWSQFTEVWQYGSDEKNDRADKQDGIAPQVAVPGIPNTTLKIPNGRAYIPETAPKGFLPSHQIKNYKWIFTRIPSENGYVKPR